MSNEIITHKFRELLLPTILIAMALNITSIVDASFVANFIGHDGQAALQVLEPLVLLISIFEWLFGLGGQILCLNKKSEFDEDGSHHYFTTSMLTTVIVSILIILVCVLFEDALIAILHPPSADLIPYVKSYGRYLFICFPIVTIMGVFSQFIRVDGQPSFASAVIILANIVNLFLDYVFLGVFHMGIDGASLATLIGYIVGAIISLKYLFDPKRTFKFTTFNLKIKTWAKSSAEIIKIGLPGASMGIFDVILVYVMNLIIGAALGEIGLDIYNVCVNGLLIISILVIGFAETLSSIVPIYYSQNDFYNLKHIVRKSVTVTLLCSLAFTVILLIEPDILLIFFKLHVMDNDSMFETAIMLFSLSFVPMAFSTMLIFYYEGIERTIESGIISVISTLLGPLLFTFILYPFMGIACVWISFMLGYILSILVVVCYVRIVERKDSEYSGLFFIKKGLIEKTRNYTIKSKNDNEKTELFNHLESLNVDSSSSETLNKLINMIFDLNDENVSIEILVIDYGDKITVNMKDEGKREVIENIEKTFSQDNVKVSEVLGLNNIEYTINEVKD